MRQLVDPHGLRAGVRSAGPLEEYPTWGAPKIRDKLIREYPMIPPPAVSTIHAALDRNGLIKRRKRRRYKACGTPLTSALAPNELWCADYKIYPQFFWKTCCAAATVDSLDEGIAHLLKRI